MSSFNSSGDDSFAALFEKGLVPQRQKRLSIGDEVDGIVVKIGSDAVFLDLDGKREAFIERASLKDSDGQSIPIEVGNRLSARVVEMGARAGGIRLEPISIRRSLQDEDDEATQQVELVDPASPRLVSGTRVKGHVVRVESYGLFVQVEGTTGRQGRGLVPAVETGVPRGTDLKKKFPLGTQLDVKILSIEDDGKIRMSLRALVADDERASFDNYANQEKKRQTSPGFGTLADAFARSKKKAPKR